MKKQITQDKLQKYLIRAEDNNTIIEVWIEAYNSSQAKDLFMRENAGYFEELEKISYKVKSVI